MITGAGQHGVTAGQQGVTTGIAQGHELWQQAAIDGKVPNASTNKVPKAIKVFFMMKISFFQSILLIFGLRNVSHYNHNLIDMERQDMALHKVPACDIRIRMVQQNQLHMVKHKVQQDMDKGLQRGNMVG